MNPPQDTDGRGYQGDPRDIPKWVRRYTQNRALPVVVMLVVFVLVALAIGGSSYLGGVAYRDGNMVLFGVCITALVIALAANLYLSVPRWGGKLVVRITQRCYAKDGNVAVSSQKLACPPRAPWALGGAFMVCVLGSVVLGFLGYFPLKYMQPISAVYVVPFLVILTIWMRPAVGWLTLLWPALYGLHAVLIVAGAPILMTGKWESLNMLIPIAGYGILSGLIGHAYSRFALHRLKKIARTGLSACDPSTEAEDG